MFCLRTLFVSFTCLLSLSITDGYASAATKAISFPGEDPLHLPEQRPRCWHPPMHIFPLNKTIVTVDVINKENHFDFISPVFEVKPSQTDVESIWWQLSASSDFSEILAEAEGDYSEIITFAEIEETLLENGATYYFHVCVRPNRGRWGPWSAPFAFSASKSETVKNVSIANLEDGRSALVWDASDTPNATYLVFGSNHSDFIPDIYKPLPLNVLIKTKEENTALENNFIKETIQSFCHTDNQFKHYRIITKNGESLSRPSPVISLDSLSQLPEKKSWWQQEFLINPADPLAPVFENPYWLYKSVSVPPSSPKPYIKNPYVNDGIWYALEPHFVPENTPEKAALDAIFSKKRVLSSLKSLSKAGFQLITDPKNKIIVAKHPYLKGYLVKIYIETMDMQDWDCWLRRVRGAKIIQAAIDLHGYQAFMKVPKKWIYPLPPEPGPTKTDTYRKDFVLLVEEIDILDDKKNRKAYKTKMTPEILNAFYNLITTYLLIDSVYADNVPFCKDGKLAFVDTEYSGDTTRPVPVSAVGQYLSPPMLAYWEQLIVNGLPQ